MNYMGFFLEHGLILEPDLEAATMDQVLLMVKNGLGIGFLPEEFARDALEKKKSSGSICMRNRRSAP